MPVLLWIEPVGDTEAKVASPAARSVDPTRVDAAHARYCELCWRPKPNSRWGGLEIRRCSMHFSVLAVWAGARSFVEAEIAALLKCS